MASPRRSPEGWRTPDARGDLSVGRWPITWQAPRLRQQGSGTCRTADLSKCLFVEGVAGNRAVSSHGCKSPPPIAEGVAGKPGCRTPGRIPYFRYSSQGCSGMTLYGYARVSVREPEDKNLDPQVERLVRAGCATGNIRAEEASGAPKRPRRPLGTAGHGGRGGHPGGHPH